MAVWQITTPPAAEPVLLAEMKNYLKIESSVTDDDDLIESLIKDARLFVERLTARSLITQTITEYFDEFPAMDRSTKPLDARVIKLHRAPVVSITSVSYIATDNDPSTYTVWDNTGNAAYFLDNISGLNGIGPARICKRKSIDWPSIEPYTNAVKVIYVTGYGSAGTDVPGPIVTAIRRLVGAWYYGRKGSFDEDFQAVNELLKPYQVHK
jgi:uncharacterized phiE125 gp8 family phage protein